MSMYVHEDDHMAIWAAETDTTPDAAWCRWIDEVERLLGTSVDGDLSTDGFSLDSFHDMWRRNWSPAEAVAEANESRSA